MLGFNDSAVEIKAALDQYFGPSVYELNLNRYNVTRDWQNNKLCWVTRELDVLVRFLELPFLT